MHIRSLPALPVAALSLGCLCLAPPADASPGTCEARSGTRTAALFELYTSEGCDSCPPADRWLADLAPEVATGQAVALAFHVDYWDYLGWRDPYGSAAFSQRQRQRVAAAGERAVYTPQVMLNGRDFRRWREPVWRNVLQAVGRRSPGAELHLSMHRDANGGWRVALDGIPTRPVSAPRLWLAHYENGLWSDVAAGENHGKRLTHDYVVRRLDGPAPTDRDGRLRLAVQLPPTRAGGVAAVMEDGASGELLQALALPFCAEPGKSGG